MFEDFLFLCWVTFDGFLHENPKGFKGCCRFRGKKNYLNISEFVPGCCCQIFKSSCCCDDQNIYENLLSEGVFVAKISAVSDWCFPEQVNLPKKNEIPKSPKILREKWILSSSITLIFFVRGAGAREGGVLLFYQPSFGEFRHISVSTSMGLRRCSNAARIAETNVQLRKNVKEMSHFTPWKINMLNPKMEAWNLEDDFLFNWVILRFQTLIFRGVHPPLLTSQHVQPSISKCASTVSITWG